VSRVPLVMDATQNRDVVDLFWTVGVFGHSFVIDVPMAMYRMKGRTPTQDPQTHAAILEEWRQKLVNAMKQVCAAPHHPQAPPFLSGNRRANAHAGRGVAGDAASVSSETLLLRYQRMIPTGVGLNGAGVLPSDQDGNRDAGHESVLHRRGIPVCCV
jgi:hypothetical protein